MEESPEEAAKREEMLRMYHACKEALRIIGEEFLEFKMKFWVENFFDFIRWRHNGDLHDSTSSASKEWLVANGRQPTTFTTEPGRSTQECSGFTGLQFFFIKILIFS